MKKYQTHSIKSKNKMKDSHKDKSLSQTTKNNISKSMSGRKLSKLHREHLRGERNPRWKGGKTSLNYRIRRLKEFYDWRFSVFKRDNFTCQKCGEKHGRLNAHHLKSLSEIISENNIKTIEQALNCAEIWYVSNGITYCKKCHKTIHKRSKK